MSNVQINEADDRLCGTLANLGLSLAVMLGHRPTRLAAESGNADYISRLGGRLTTTRLPNGRVMVLLWIIDPSHRRFVQPDNSTYRQIFQLVPIVIQVVERLLFSIGIESNSTAGIPEAYADKIVN
jgi:hypothetical protein